MLTVSNELKNAFMKDERTIYVRIKIGNRTFGNDNVVSVEYDSGSLSGEVFAIGSTYSNSIKITFSELVEGLKELDEVTYEIGIKLADSKIEYVPMGVFVINDAIEMDRNNNKTTIECMDRMVMLGGAYASSLTYPAAIREVALEIANKAGVSVDVTSFERLSADGIAKPEGYTYREAIGLIAQFEAGFATFNRYGKLEIRTLSDPNFAIPPDNYFSKGLVKNEVFFRLGGISCTTDDGDTIIQSGNTAGNQIVLENRVMTKMLLDKIYQKIQTINYYPFSLSWQGNPVLEAGDWVEVEDLQGNKFKTPNLSYSLSFNGGLSAKSSAETVTQSDATYQYKSPLQQKIEWIHARIDAAGGNVVYEGVDEPANPKEGDLWFKIIGPDKEILIYKKRADGSLFWEPQISTADIDKVAKEVGAIIEQADEDRQATEQKFDQSVADAKAYTEQKANEFKNQLEIVRADVADTELKANAALAKANQAIEDAGFMKVDVDAAKANSITALTTAQNSYDEAVKALNKAAAVETITGTLTTNYDALTKTVGMKAEKEVVNGISQTVDKHTLDIKANADGLKFKAEANLVNTIKGTVDNHTAELGVQAQAINARLTSTQVDSLVTAKGYVNQAQLTATSDKWNLALTQVSTDLEGLDINDRNLLPNSGNFTSSSGWLGGTVKQKDGYSVLEHSSTIRTEDLQILEPNTEYIVTMVLMLSTDFNATAAVPNHLYVTKQVGDPSNSGTQSGITIVGGNRTLKANTWETVSVRFKTIDTNDKLYIRVHLYPSTIVATRWLRSVKVQKGTKATDWTPAPEDMATLEQFTTIDATVKGLQTTVGNKADKTQVTQLSNQWTQTTALVNGHTGQISNLGEQINLRVTSSQVTEAILVDKTVKDTRNDNQLPSWYFTNYKKQTVEEFKWGDVIGAIPNSAYGLLTTKVPWSDSSGGAITQTFSTASGVYQRRGSSSWGVWEKVADANRLISQINISPESILIASNKITLSGDTYMDAAFINKMKVHSVDAVVADIATVRTKMLTADVITSTMLKSDTAMINKLFATTALIDTLTSKAAFINSVKAIDIAADRITAGTLNAAKVTIINLDASRITTGTITGITIKSPFDYIYEGAIRNNGTTTLSNGNLTMNGTFTNAYGSTFLSINPDTIYAENMQANGTVRSMFKLSGKGLELNQLGSSASYTQDGVYFESGGGAFIKYHRGNARIETGSYNGVGLGAIPNGVYQNRLTVGGGSDGLGPFVDIWAPLTVREGMNVMGKEIRNASFITGADVILFNNTTNRIVQGTNGIMNILSPIQIDLGYTDGTYGSPSLSITNNAVTMRKSLQMSGNRIDGASTINGAYSINGANNILFHNTTNRIVQGSDGFLNILSPMQLSLGWTDGVSSFTTMIITKNQVVAKRNLNMDGNQMVGVSDSRLKTAIDNTVMDSLSAISRWKFVDFNWRYDDKPKGRQFGLIAQDTPELALYDAQNDEYTISASKQIMMTSHGLSQLNVKVKSLSALTDASNATANQALSETQKLRQEIQVLRQKIEKLESAA